MSYMKPDEVIKMYQKYILPPYQKELKNKGQELTLDLEDEYPQDMQFIKDLSGHLDNKLDRTHLKNLLEDKETPGFIQKMVLTLFNTAKEYSKSPEFEENFKRDADLLLSKDPRERLEGVKNIFTTLNDMLPEHLKLKGERLKNALEHVLRKFNENQPDKLEGDDLKVKEEIDKLVTSVLVGEKEKSQEKAAAPTPGPKPKNPKEQMLVSESGDFIEKLGFAADPQAKGITTVTELLTQPLSVELQENLKEGLGKVMQDPSMAPRPHE